MKTVEDLVEDFSHKYPNKQVYSLDGTLLSKKDAIYPCGAIAKYIYDDAISIKVNGELNEIDQRDIDFDYDDAKFKNIDKDNWKSI